jgi:hypothetical protein
MAATVDWLLRWLELQWLVSLAIISRRAVPIANG